MVHPPVRLPLLLLLACGRLAAAERPPKRKGGGDVGECAAGQQCDDETIAIDPQHADDGDKTETELLQEQLAARLAQLNAGRVAGKPDAGGGGDETETKRLQDQLNARLAQSSSGRATQPGARTNDDEEDGYDIEGVDPKFLDYLNGLEIYEVPEMHAALSDIVGNAGLTTPMQRHVEALVAKKRGAAEAHAPFGSLLDVSTAYSASWGGSTEFGGKVSWIASMFYRRDILEHERGAPCGPDEIDDCDIEEDDACCHVGVSIDDYVSVRGTEEKLYEHMELAAYWDILDEGEWRTGTVMEIDFGDQRFDTILASGIVTGEDGYAVAVMKKLKSLMNPGGVVFLVGTEPPERVEGPAGLYTEMLEEIDSAKQLAGESPTRNFPATWIDNSLGRLGLDVFSSTRFPIRPTFDDISETVEEAFAWIDEAESPALTSAVKSRYKQEWDQMLDRLSGVARGGPIFAGEYQYIIAAELPRMMAN